MSQNKFSAIVELVGLKYLVEEDPEEYMRVTQDFLKTLMTIHRNSKDLTVYAFRDHCYIESESIEALYSDLKNLRAGLLLDSSAFIRGAVIQGELQATPIRFPDEKNTIIHGFNFSSTASELFGMQEKIKGIGISVSRDLANRESLPNPSVGNDIKLVKVPSTELTINYYIPDCRNHRYEQYFDIALDDDFMTQANLQRILRQFKEARAFSKKHASFFVPILLLWAKATSLKVRRLDKELDEYLCEGELNTCRDITGFELIHFSFMDKVFSDSKEVNNLDEKRVQQLQGYFKRQSWVSRFISNDQPSVNIPRDIFRTASKRRFAKHVSS